MPSENLIFFPSDKVLPLYLIGTSTIEIFKFDNFVVNSGQNEKPFSRSFIFLNIFDLTAL